MQGSALKKTRTSGVYSLNVYCFLILLCFQKSSLVLHSRPRAKLMTSWPMLSQASVQTSDMAEGLYRLQITGLPKVFINQECADPKNEGCEANLVSFQSRASFVPVRTLPLTLL